MLHKSWSLKKIEQVYAMGFRPWMLIIAPIPTALCWLFMIGIANLLIGDIHPIIQIAVFVVCFLSVISTLMEDRNNFIENRRKLWLQ